MEHPNDVYIAIFLVSVKQKLEYLKDDLKDWEVVKKFESEEINIVHATISIPYKQKLGRTDKLKIKKIKKNKRSPYRDFNQNIK